MIVFNERSLHRTLTSFSSYYHCWRTHLSLGKDAPQGRRTQTSDEGTVVEIRKSVVCIITTNARLPDQSITTDREPFDRSCLGAAYADR
jgi:hypothetical protein